MQERKPMTRFGPWLVWAVALAAAIPFAGCRQPQPMPRISEAKAVRPITLNLLCLMPDSAEVAVAVPSGTEAFPRWAALTKALAPDPAKVDAAIENKLHETAGLLGIAVPESFAALARAVGIDPDAPMALFLGPSFPPVDVAASASAASTGGARPTLDQLQEFLSTVATEARAAGSRFTPNFACVFRCTDPALADQVLAETLSRTLPADATLPDPIAVGNVAIRHYVAGTPSYFLAGHRIVVGSTLEIVKGVAAKLANPLDVRYGSLECPARSKNEAVVLVRADHPVDVLARVLPGLPLLDSATPGWHGSLGSAVRPVLEAYGGQDPVVITMLLDEAGLDAALHVDHETHPQLPVLCGAPLALRHASALPDSTLATASFALPDPLKDRLTAFWLASMPPEMTNDPQYSQVAPMARRIMGLLGDEVTVAVLRGEEGRFVPVLLLALADPEETKEFLWSLGLSAPTVESYNGVDVFGFPAGFLVSFGAYFAFPDDSLIVSSDLTELIALMGRLEHPDSSGSLLASLEAPLDPDVPRYRTMILRGDAGSLSELIGQVHEESAGFFGRTETVVREFQWRSQLAGSWRSSRVIVRFQTE